MMHLTNHKMNDSNFNYRKLGLILIYFGGLFVFLLKCLSFFIDSHLGSKILTQVVLHALPDSTGIPDLSNPTSTVPNNDSVTINNINQRLDHIEGAIAKVGEGISKVGGFLGGGWAISQVVQVIPHPTGKVVVGAVGLGSMFLSGAVRSVWRRPEGRSPGGSVSNSLLSMQPGVPLESDVVIKEYIENCLMICSTSTYFVYILTNAFILEIFRKSIIKFLQREWLPKLFNQIGSFFDKKAFASISLLYIIAIVVLLVLNLTYIVIAVEGLKFVLSAKKDMLLFDFNYFDYVEVFVFIAVLCILVVLASIFMKVEGLKKPSNYLLTSNQKLIGAMGLFLLWFDVIFLGLSLFYVIDEVKNFIKDFF